MGIPAGRSLAISFGLLVCLMFQINKAEGKDYIVGDAEGWSPHDGLSEWPRGKTFKAGDVLIFKYKDPNFYVSVLNSGGYYDLCEVYGAQTEILITGNDRAVLKKGENYFVTANYDYCMKGMKIKVIAE